MIQTAKLIEERMQRFMITMTVNHVEVESYEIHRCLKAVGRINSIHQSSKDNAIAAVYFNKPYGYSFMVLYNKHHPNAVVIKTEAFDIRYENGKAEVCNTKIAKLMSGNYLLLYNDLTKALSAHSEYCGTIGRM